MALLLKDRVKETTTTTGTGDITLAGAVEGFQSFSSALSDADTTYYAISHRDADEWEVGLGTYSSGVLTRTTVLESSNSDTAVSFAAGTKDIFITLPAEKAVVLDASDDLNVGNITTTGYLRGPATFTIDPAAHGDDTGTLVIAGNLQVDGTTTTINSTTVSVDDLNIVLASGSANAAAANGAGITIDGASATLTYDSATDRWTMNKDLTANLVGNVTGTISLGDNDKANFGAGSDLQIYHDGSNSYIKEAGQGALVLQGTHMYLKSTADEYYLKNTADGSVEVYHNGSPKLATTSTGVDVTGTITSDGLTVSNNAAGIADAIELENFSGESSYIKAKRGLTLSADYDNNSSAAQSNITFETDGTEAMRIDSSGNVGIGTTLPSEALTVIGSSVVGDTTTSYNQLTVNGGHVGDGDNDYGITINAFEPAITLLDRSTGSGSGQMRVQSDGSFWFLRDSTNDGTIGHTSNTTDSVIAKLQADGTVTATSFAGGGAIILVDAQSDSTSYTTTSKSYQTASRFQITPSTSTSRLMGWFYCQMRATGGVSDGDMGNTARVYYLNSSNAWTASGNLAQNLRTENSVNTGMQEIAVTFPILLDQGDLNSSGVWDVAIRHYEVYDATSAIDEGRFCYMEYEP